MAGGASPHCSPSGNAVGGSAARAGLVVFEFMTCGKSLLSKLALAETQNRYVSALSPEGGHWSFHICETVRRILRRMAVVHPQPSPPWGRGWRATGVLISRGATGEGVKTVNPTKTTGTTQLRRVHRERRDRETGGIGRSGTAFTAGPPMTIRRKPTQRRLIVEEDDVGTPSPVPPRLMKAPVAVHPLPQGGEG